MSRSHLNELKRICGDMENIVLNMENMSMKDLDARFSGMYKRMTEVVGAVMLEQDEMSGKLE